MGPVVGHGKFGTVRKASPRNNPEKTVAIKCIELAMVQEELHLLRTEIDALRAVDHPHIVKIHGTFMDEEVFYIVMDYCNGGDLFDHIMDNGKFESNEAAAAKMVRQIISGLKHLHEHNICHRDIKPENIIIDRET